MKLITIIVFLIPVVVARHNHRTVIESILKSKDNLYTKVENDVQNVMNNLFDELNLAPSFIEKSRIKLLSTMHYDLNNIAEKNYDVFEKLTEAARPGTGNKSSEGVALFKLIEKTLNDKPFNISVKLNEAKMSREPTIHETATVQHATTISIAPGTSLENISLSDPVFADSKEFMTFIRDFIKKVDKLNETDFSKSTPLLPPIEEDTTQPDLDVWQPPALDYFNDSIARRIFKGKRSRAKTYPFVASIHLMEMFVCAGSILSSDLIITAASCLQILHNNRFFRENPRSVSVRIGSDYFSRGGELIPVLEAFFHPSYNPKNLANNLVLLRLVRHIRFFRSQKTVKRIRYDTTKSHLPLNIDGIIVVGWGSRKLNNIIDQFERIMVTKLDVYQLHECAQIYSKQFVTNKHFCAGFISKGGGACNKDLGGPGVIGGELVGIISFGAPLCGAIDSPTVFTKLGYYAKWIDSVIELCGLHIAVRTTLKFNTDKHYFLDPTPPTRENPYFSPEKTTRGTIMPVMIVSEETEEYEPVVRRRATPRSQIHIYPYTPTTRYSMLIQKQLLRSILYGDYGLETEDFNDMFKTTQHSNIKQHPLVNLSLYPIPGVYKENLGTRSTKFIPVPLTLSSQFTSATGTSTKPSITHQATTMEHHITDLLTPGPEHLGTIQEQSWTVKSEPALP